MGLGVVAVLALASANVMASTAAAMLHGNGGVSVNGSSVMQTTTVFSGDRIETAPNSSVNLSMNGSSILVSEKSSLIFNGADVSFASGGAIVKTTQGLSARFRQVNVAPSKLMARFQLLQKGNILKVAALEGDLAIANGNKNIALVAGQSVDIPLSEQERQSGDRTEVAQNSDGGSGTADSSAPSPDPRQAQPLPAGSDKTGLIVGGIEATGVAIAGLVLVSQKPISPKGP
jgi:hypothetical protein